MTAFGGHVGSLPLEPPEAAPPNPPTVEGISDFDTKSRGGPGRAGGLVHNECGDIAGALSSDTPDTKGERGSHVCLYLL